MVNSALANFASYFQNYGIADFVLPFIFIFTITYAIFKKSEILVKKDANRDGINITVALVMGLIFVVPHLTGNYPLGYDPVEIMNNSLPHISVVSVAAIMVLLLLGIFGKDFGASFTPFILIIALGFVIFIFGASLGLWNSPQQTFSWWNDELTELVIIVLIFGIVIWFITRTPPDKAKKDERKAARDAWIQNLLKPR
jgi:hypothetical protein